MSKIVNVKLITGEEVVAVLAKSETEGKVLLMNPSFVVQVPSGELDENGHNIMVYDLAPFSPFSAFEDNLWRVFDISEDHVMFISEPTIGATNLYKMYHGSEEDKNKALEDLEEQNKVHLTVEEPKLKISE